MFTAARARLHPLTALLVGIWGLTLTYTGLAIPPLILGLALLRLAGLLRRLAPLYAWLVVPVGLIVGLAGGPLEGARAALSLLALAAVASSSLALVDPLEAAYMASRLGLPPIIGFMPSMVSRVAGYMANAIQEARAGLSGRGLQGVRLLVSIPVPLVVHAFMLSSLMGEALFFKYPPRSRSWYRRPSPGLLDAVVLLYVAASTILYGPLLHAVGH